MRIVHQNQQFNIFISLHLPMLFTRKLQFMVKLFGKSTIKKNSRNIKTLWLLEIPFQFSFNSTYFTRLLAFFHALSHHTTNEELRSKFFSFLIESVDYGLKFFEPLISQESSST